MSRRSWSLQSSRWERAGFLVFVAASVGLSLYFAASGLWALGRVSVEAETAIESAEWQPLAAAPVASKRKSAQPILERNPFDSVTGPLTPGAAEEGETVARPPLDLSQPLAAPRCETVRVYSTAESDDPRWSLAVAQAKDEPQSQLVRVGDEVGALEVAYIGYNWAERSPSVWFVTTDELCQSLVFTDRPRFKSALSKPPVKKARAKKSPRKKRRPKARKGPPPLPREIADKVTQVSPDEFRIDRSIVDTLLQKGPELLRSTRIVPVKENGKVDSMRITKVGAGTLLGKLGFKNGDRLRTINGLNVSNPEKALKAYANLRRASDIVIHIERSGKPMTLDYKIR